MDTSEFSVYNNEVNDREVQSVNDNLLLSDLKMSKTSEIDPKKHVSWANDSMKMSLSNQDFGLQTNKKHKQQSTSYNMGNSCKLLETLIPQIRIAIFTHCRRINVKDTNLTMRAKINIKHLEQVLAKLEQLGA